MGLGANKVQGAVAVSAAKDELNNTAKQAAREKPERSARAQKAADKKLLAKLDGFYRQLCAPYTCVSEQARAITLAFITKEHCLLVGETGDAKSSLAERAVALVEARIFKTQVNPFTLPEHLLGPLKVKKFMDEETMERNSKGMIQEADFAYIDELYRAEAMLDLFLEIFNERRAEHVPLPLRSVICATNDIPYESHYAAIHDRQALRYFVPRLPLEYVPDLLDKSWDIEFKGAAKVERPALNLEELDRIYAMLDTVDRSIVRAPLLKLFNELELVDKILISNRRRHQAEKIVAASALLNGRTVATMEDLLALKYVIPYDRDESLRVTDRLENMVSPINHVNRLEKHLRNFEILIADLEADIHSLNNIKNIEEINTVKSQAKSLLKDYSDLQLKDVASRTVSTADKLMSKMNEASKAIAAEEKKDAALAATVRSDKDGVS